MRNGWRLITELDFGVLRARGADAVAFLQGQLSNDVSRLRDGELQLSGYHSPQGRTIALLRLTSLAPDDVLALLPRELVAPVIARLKKFVLRSKVQLSDECAQWQVIGFQGAAPAGVRAVSFGRGRQLVIVAADARLPEADAVRGGRSDWLAADIEEGLPQVYLATSEAFVAQMLNLDVTGGIAFDKGCYTGQEIIARAHYRGHVKRRMQRFVTDGPCELAPGLTGVFPDGRSFKVVTAVTQGDGRCEFLAVANPAPGLAADESEAAPSEHPLIAAQPLPLPYDLPQVRP